MLSIEKRVRRTEEGQEYDLLGLVGTVVKCSQFGYVRVRWDNGIEDGYSPMAAAKALREVTGDDALPRHSWDLDIELDPPCLICRVIQTDENEFGPCKPEVKS
jgi:hypothetical protein